MVIVDTVGAATIYWAILAGNVGPLAVGGEDEVNVHARHATDEEGDGVDHLFVHSLLVDLDQEVG